MTQEVYTGYYNSPCGLIKVVADEKTIISVNFVTKEDEVKKKNSIIEDAIHQLDEYFKKKRKEFELELSFQGTEFQKKVWIELLKIPYGEVISYKELANRIGRPDATRAVANAVGKNPIAIIVPCHRVIRANSQLGGYAGGIDKKIWLLEHEGCKILQKP